jgi:hypothetical protein
MEAFTATRISECPFLQPGRPAGRPAAAIYCRLPGGRVRIPTIEEQRRFCLAGGWEECPVHELHAGEAHAAAV